MKPPTTEPKNTSSDLEKEGTLKKPTVSERTKEFIKFHKLLMQNAPNGYIPHYFKLNPGEKVPLTKINQENGEKYVIKWSELKHRLTAEEAAEYIKQGGNIGIGAMENDPLVLEDIDDTNITNLETLKPTLTSQTARGDGRHLFYFEQIHGLIPNIPSEDAGEVRANDQYVVTPGSYVTEYEVDGNPVDGKGFYKVIAERPCAIIGSITELAPIFVEQLKKDFENRKAGAEREAQRKLGKKDESPREPSLFFNLSIHDIFAALPGDPAERFPSLFHDSKTGQNTSVSNDLIHCWRHGVSLNAQQALAVLSGFLTCQEAGTAHKHGGGGLSHYTGNDEALYEAWKYAKKELGLLPLTDPVPIRAMNHVAVKEGFCEAKDVVDGWKLPIEVYNKVLTHFESIGIKHGRTLLITKPKTKGGEGKKHEERIEDVSFILDHLFGKYKFITLEDTDNILSQERTGLYASAEALIKKEIETLYGVETTEYFVREILGHVRRRTYIKREAINKDGTKLPFLNGLLNLKTFELEPFDENLIFTYQIPYPYDSSKKIPTPVLDWITEIVGEDNVPLLQQHSGYVFEPAFPVHKTLWLGGTGRNGKGAYVRLLSKAIGVKNLSHVPLEQMNPHYRFALFALYGTFFNPVSEPSTKYEFRTESFKTITGGDELEAEIKGKQERIKFTPFSKIWVHGNKYPMPQDDTDAFWERVDTINFPNKYVGEKRIPNIEEKLIEENGGIEAIQGFINWCLEGLRYLKENNYQFSYSRDSEQRKLDFRRMSDTIGAFLQERVVIDARERYPQSELYAKYTTYCFDNELEPQKMSGFTTRLKTQRGVVLRPGKWEKQTTKCWFGLRLKTKEEEKKLPKVTKLPTSDTLVQGENSNKNNENNIKNNENIIKKNEPTLTTLATDETNNETIDTEKEMDNDEDSVQGVQAVGKHEQPEQNLDIGKKYYREYLCPCGKTYHTKEKFDEHINGCGAYKSFLEKYTPELVSSITTYLSSKEGLFNAKAIGEGIGNSNAPQKITEVCEALREQGILSRLGTEAAYLYSYRHDTGEYTNGARPLVFKCNECGFATTNAGAWGRHNVRYGHNSEEAVRQGRDEQANFINLGEGSEL